MSLRHEIPRQEADEQLDQLLQTDAGRTTHWATLFENCHRDSMVSLLESTLHLPGDVIECGVYRGGSLRRICRTLKDQSPHKSVYACDSYEEFPEEKVGRVDLGFLRFLHRVKKKFQLAGDVPERMERFFDMYGIDGQIVKGYFSDTLGRFEHHTFCFIHLDCDIYESYKECLTVLYPKLTPGGVVVFDDYGSSKWPGAKKAVDEFFSGMKESPCLSTDRQEPSWYVRKPAASN